jgi:hypothetical protein
VTFKCNLLLFAIVLYWILYFTVIYVRMGVNIYVADIVHCRCEALVTGNIVSAVQSLVITYSIVIALFSPYIPSVEFGEYASLKLFGFTRVYYLVCVAIFCIYGLCMWGIIMLTRFLVIDEYLVVLKFFWPLEL